MQAPGLGIAFGLLQYAPANCRPSVASAPAIATPTSMATTAASESPIIFVLIPPPSPRLPVAKCDEIQAGRRMVRLEEWVPRASPREGGKRTRVRHPPSTGPLFSVS